MVGERRVTPTVRALCAAKQVGKADIDVYVFLVSLFSGAYRHDSSLVDVCFRHPCRLPYQSQVRDPAPIDACIRVVREILAPWLLGTCAVAPPYSSHKRGGPVRMGAAERKPNGRIHRPRTLQHKYAPARWHRWAARELAGHRGAALGRAHGSSVAATMSSFPSAPKGGYIGRCGRAGTLGLARQDAFYARQLLSKYIVDDPDAPARSQLAMGNEPDGKS